MLFIYGQIYLSKGVDESGLQNKIIHYRKVTRDLEGTSQLTSLVAAEAMSVYEYKYLPSIYKKLYIPI